jgi:hypothetical protein
MFCGILLIKKTLVTIVEGLSPLVVAACNHSREKGLAPKVLSCHILQYVTLAGLVLKWKAL